MDIHKWNTDEAIRLLSNDEDSYLLYKEFLDNKPSPRIRMSYLEVLLKDYIDLHDLQDHMSFQFISWYEVDTHLTELYT